MFMNNHPESNWTLPTGMRVFKTHDAMSSERRHLLERIAFQHGQYSESYLVTEPNRSYLWSSLDDGVVGFIRHGRYLVIVGGLITDAEHKARFLAEICLFARLNKLNITFYHIDERDIPLFEARSFQITKSGVDAQIPLTSHNWSGKPFEWVRRQYNFVRRQNVLFSELLAAETSPADWERQFAEMQEVSAEHIGTKHFRGEIPFFEGRLLNDHLYRRRVFLARADKGLGRLEGFVVCTPIRNGRQWAMEMYRHRIDAVRGIIPFLMHETINQLKADGCDGVSMCPIPAIGCEVKRPGDSFVARTAYVLWNKIGNAIFDTKGLYHYKSRFRPDFREIFSCAYPRTTIGGVWAYMTLVRMFDLKIGVFLKDLIHQWNPQRRTLAKPVFVPPSTAAGDILPASATAPASAEYKVAL